MVLGVRVMPAQWRHQVVLPDGWADSAVSSRPVTNIYRAHHGILREGESYFSRRLMSPDRGLVSCVPMATHRALTGKT